MFPFSNSKTTIAHKCQSVRVTQLYICLSQFNAISLVFQAAKLHRSWLTPLSTITINVGNRLHSTAGPKINVMLDF